MTNAERKYWQYLPLVYILPGGSSSWGDPGNTGLCLGSCAQAHHIPLDLHLSGLHLEKQKHKNKSIILNLWQHRRFWLTKKEKKKANILTVYCVVYSFSFSGRNFWLNFKVDISNSPEKACKCSFSDSFLDEHALEWTLLHGHAQEVMNLVFSLFKPGRILIKYTASKSINTLLLGYARCWC